MRKQLLGVFLPLLAVGFMVAAETQGTGTQTTASAATKRAALKRLNVVRADDGISIEITANGQVTPKLSAMNRPNRLVVDLPNTVDATEQRPIAVDSEGVTGIRVGMDGQVPPTTRIVVDLQEAMKYELVPGSDKLVLKLHTSGVAAKATPAASHSAQTAQPKQVAVNQ